MSPGARAPRGTDHGRPAWIARSLRISRFLGAMLLALVAAEATVRIGVRFLPGVRMLAEPNGARRNEPETFAEFQRAYREHLIPNRSWYGFPCNSLGFHDREFAAEVPPGTLRVVALGDSFTHGPVPYSRSYLALAEALLVLAWDRGDGKKAVQLDNLGVPASGITDYRLVYSFVGRALEPDVVLVTLYLGNDPRDFVDPVHFGPERVLPASYLLTFAGRAGRLFQEQLRSKGEAGGGETTPNGAISAAAVPGAAPRAVRYSDDEGAFARPSFSDEAFAPILRRELEMLARPGTPLPGPDWDGFRRALAALVDDVERDGARVVLALAPARLQIYPDELRATAARESVSLADVDPDLPNREVAAFAKERGLSLIDLTPALRDARSSGGRLYRPNDTHWGLRGNTIAAAELARRLAELDLPRPAS